MNSTSTDPYSRNRKRFRAFLAMGVVLLVVAGGIFLSLQPDLLQQAAQAYDRGDYRKSLRIAASVLESDARQSQAALLAGRSAAQLEQFRDAIRFFDRVSREDADDRVAASLEAGDLLLFQLLKLSQAEVRFRQALEIEPDHPVANNRLLFLLGLSGRQFEQIPLALRVIRGRQFQPAHLLSLALGAEGLENPELARRYHQSDPDDPLPMIALARIAVEDQHYPEARKLLEKAVTQSPELAEAQSRLGELLFEHGTESEFLRWHAALPASATQHPRIWVLRARWCEKQSMNEHSVRCYGEALRLAPNASRPNYQIGRLLKSLGHDREAEAFLERSRRLREFINTVKVAHSGTSLKLIRRAAETAESLGLIWEAYGWAVVPTLKSRQAPTSWAAKLIERTKPRLATLPLRRSSPGSTPLATVDLGKFPLPKLPGSGGQSPGRAPAVQDDTQVAFRDAAAKAGIRFRYFNGKPSVDRGLTKMYEFSGGGIGVLDFDRDGRPDLHLTQGSAWPPRLAQRDHLDRLYQNIGNTRFADVTARAGIVESGFSQGVSVGDFNSDGFPDLFVANIGKNRLYLNNGDGTFSDATAAAGIDDDRWTTSCLIADLNGDGHPDLYAVNYVTGHDVFTRVCRSGDRDGICLPQNFPAEQDRVYLSSGTGTFRDATRKSGIERKDGKGLGIVAADFDDSGRLSLFVANDTTPNFYFKPVSPKGPGKPLFTEMGLTGGTGMNGAGRTESCMGIAAGDVDGDGRLDLYVTNFFAESNTLYLQRSPHLFEDATRQSGLFEGSLPMVGFGTQFLDGDLDGDLDLFLTNGHIDDFRSTGTADYKMPPQFYTNSGQGRFTQRSARSLGPYFAKKYLGRAVALLDWNNDGLDDVAVSHLDAPLALLTNRSANVGRFLVVRCVATTSSRDAIGTTITVESGGRRLVRQLTAGDGYQASNERKLVFGLADATTADRMTVRWPSGRREVFEKIAANSRWILVEGTGRLLAAPAE